MGHPVQTHLALQYDTRRSATAAADRGMLIEETHSLVLLLRCIHPPLKMPATGQPLMYCNCTQVSTTALCSCLQPHWLQSDRELNIE